MNNARYMRATVAAWLVAVSALAADPLVVEFSLVNLGVQPATNRSVIITPIILEPGPGQVAVYDRVLRNTGLSGKFYLTNLMVGMYRVTVQTPPDTTTYAIAVTTNDVGRVSADKMLVAMPTAVVRPQDYPYSAQASDRRYAPASVSTTATGWKLVEPEYAGGTNTFAPVYQLTQGNGIVVIPETTAVGSGLYTVKTQWMELDREIVVWTNAAGDLITRSPHDEVDDIYVFTSQAGATNFDATTGWPGWGIGWQGLTNSGVLAAKWSWTTNYVLQGWGLNGQVPEDGAVLAWGTGLDYTTNGGVWTVYATNIPARSLGTSNAPSAGKVLTVDAGTNLYWGDGGGGTGQTNWPFTAITNAPWFTAGTNTLPSGVDFVLMGEAPGDDPKLVVPWQSDVPVYSTSGFKGSGEQLTHLNASNLYSGTVPLARLSGITSNQIADSTLGTNKLDANAYALLTKTGGGSGTATNLAPGLNATNLTLVKGTNTLAGTDTGWSFTGTLAGDGGRLANVPVPRNAILTNVTLVQDGGAGAAKIIVTNRTAIGGGAADQTAIWFTPSSKVSEMIFSQDSPRVHSGIMFWPNHSSGVPELIFNCQPGSLCYYYDYIQWGNPTQLGPTYEYWKSSTYSGWIDRQSGKTNFWMWPGATWQFEARVRTNTGPNDVVFAGSRDLVSGAAAKRPTMMFRPTSTNGSGAWIFMDDFDAANSQSGLFQAVTPWGTNWHKIFRDNTYTERLRITAGPDGGLSFNGRFIVNGKEGVTGNLSTRSGDRLTVTSGVVSGISKATPLTYQNANATAALDMAGEAFQLYSVSAAATTLSLKNQNDMTYNERQFLFRTLGLDWSPTFPDWVWTEPCPEQLTNGQMLLLTVKSFGNSPGHAIATPLVLADKGYVIDPDATNYCAFVGITNKTYQVAINQLMVDAKAHGWWTNCDLIYPMLGETLDAARWNLKATNAYPITWNGATMTTTGVLFNGSSDYGNTGFKLTNSVLNIYTNNLHLFAYVEQIGTNANVQAAMGIEVGGSGYTRLACDANPTNWTAAFNTIDVYDCPQVDAMSEPRGPVLGNITPSDGKVRLTFAGRTGTGTENVNRWFDNQVIVVGAESFGGGAARYLKGVLAGATVGAGIPTNNVAQFIADWDAFNARVGRKVP